MSATDQQFEVFPGVYRGRIAATDDPERRKRYRVRVVDIHPDEVEVNHLPWAELGATFGGTLFGDIPGFEVGDSVWVMFEKGNRRFPVIMGGVFNYGGGIPPLPAEQAGDQYMRTAQRWIRVDRAGNKIELSPLPDELWIRIETPDGNRVELSQNDGAITVRGSGRVIVDAPSVQVNGAETVTVTTETLLADVTGKSTLRCLGDIDVRSATQVNIGENETSDPLTSPETTPIVNIKATSIVKIESADLIDIDSAGDILVDSAGRLVLNSAGDIDIDTANDLLIDSVRDIVVNSGRNMDVDVAGDMLLDTVGSILVTGNGNIEVTCSSEMTVSSTGRLALSSNSQLTLDAPQIEVTASSILTLDGGSLARVLGTSITLN